MEDSGIDSDPKPMNHVEDDRLFLVSFQIYFLINQVIRSSLPEKKFYNFN